MPAYSLDANALSGDVTCNLGDEIARGVIDVRSECAFLRVTVLSQIKRLTQVNRPLEISIRVIDPHTVSQLDSAARSLCPGAKTNVVGTRVHIRIMYFCPAKVPNLESFLDRLPPYAELNVPQSHDGRVDRPVDRRGRSQLLTDCGNHSSFSTCHRREAVPTGSECASAKSYRYGGTHHKLRPRSREYIFHQLPPLNL